MRPRGDLGRRDWRWNVSRDRDGKMVRYLWMKVVQHANCVTIDGRSLLVKVPLVN